MITSSLVLAVMASLSHSLSLLSPTVFDVDMNPGGMVSVSLGCPLTLECSGSGTAIKWIRFLSQAPLNTTKNPVTTTMKGMNFWTTVLMFPYFTSDLGGSYLCQITSTISLSMNVQVKFDPVPIQISEIQNINISQYTVGDVVTIGCPVTTCASRVTVTISPSTAAKEGSITYNNTGAVIQNFVLTVHDNLANSYTLTAYGTFFDGSMSSVLSASRVVYIVGTPMPRAITPAPTETATPPSKGGSPGSVANIAVQLFSLVLTVTLAALLSVKV